MNSGFFLINKTSGSTSHDIIYQLRKITKIKKIGHAGTLDPFASGLLLVAIEDATKLLRHYVGMDKTYEAILKLGAKSDTQDCTGNIININTPTKFTKTQIQKILKSFIGKQKQIPPMYSAKKINGQRLYKLAREGKEIKRKSVNIEIYNIKLISYSRNTLKIECKVSSGTYIRTLAHDIGVKMGCGAYLKNLKRTAIGELKLKNAVNVDKVGSLMNTPSHNKNIKHNNWLKYLKPMKTVLVFGTFDGIHKGHINYFQQARKLGHRLFAIVARDITVKKIKNKKTRFSEKERIKQVKSCNEIDRVYLGIDGDKNKIYNFVTSIKPDIIALGYDQKVYTKNLEKEIKKRGLNVKVVRMKAFKPKKYKSSIINAKKYLYI